MNGSLKRALAFWLASRIDGLRVYADDLANAQHRYPCCTVTELAHEVGPVGCGMKDYTVRDPDTGYVTASGRMHRAAESFRLTVTSPSGAELHGQEIVDRILAAIERAIMWQALSPALLVLVDTETEPSDAFSVERLIPAGRQAIPPDMTGEPFLYRGSLTVRLAYYIPVEQPVEHVIEQIHVTEG